MTYHPVHSVPSFVILVSAVLVLSCGHTDRQTDRITDTVNRLTHATSDGVSNNTFAQKQA